MARNFNGSSQYGFVTVPTFALATSALSLSAWVYFPTVPGSGGTLFGASVPSSSGAYLGIGYNSSFTEFIAFAAAPTETDTPVGPAVAAKKWFQILCVFFNGTQTVYVNGGTPATAVVALPSPTQLSIGSLEISNAFTSFTPAIIGECAAWYGASLSQSEARELAAGAPASRIRPANLFAYWRLNGGGPIEPDLSPYNRRLAMVADPPPYLSPPVYPPIRRKTYFLPTRLPAATVTAYRPVWNCYRGDPGWDHIGSCTTGACGT